MSPALFFRIYSQCFWSRWSRPVWRYLLAVLALGLIWAGLHVALGERLLPAPWSVLSFLGAWAGTAPFWTHVGASTGRLLPGLVLAWGGGFTLGLLLGHARRLDGLVAPLVFLTYPVPKIVLLPVLLTLFGLGDLPRILLIALTTGYQILVVTRSSALHLDPKYLDAFRSMGGSQIQAIRHVLIPAALPDGLTALRVASGTAVAVLFMAESFATTSGLGFLIMDAWGRGDQLEMFAAIVAISLLGLALYELCNILERLLCSWITTE